MPRFLELERRQRSIVLAMWRASRKSAEKGTSGARWSLFVTFREGMEDLVTTLASCLPAGAAMVKRRVTALDRHDGRWRITTAEGDRFDADVVIVAAEAHGAARLLRYVDPTITALLDEVPYSSAATVSFGWKRADIPHPLDGFGFVVPRSERRAILAGTFSSVKYPGRAPEGHVLIRCFMGGALNAEVLARDDAGLAEAARRDLGDALGIVADPVVTRVSRWPASMPQYPVGHLARVETIERRLAALPGLHLAGGAYRGVGIADCVRSGEAAADRAIGGV
jgi:oxygen-dependent protoporphyrinogen oxidase